MNTTLMTNVIIAENGHVFFVSMNAHLVKKMSVRIVGMSLVNMMFVKFVKFNQENTLFNKQTITHWYNERQMHQLPIHTRL